MPNDEKLTYSPTEIHKESGVPLRTVQRACRKVRPVFKPGKTRRGCRYDKDEVDAVLGYRDAKPKGRPREYELKIFNGEGE